jgi:hypothetical protein
MDQPVPYLLPEAACLGMLNMYRSSGHFQLEIKEEKFISNLQRARGSILLLPGSIGLQNKFYLIRSAFYDHHTQAPTSTTLELPLGYNSCGDFPRLKFWLRCILIR